MKTEPEIKNMFNHCKSFSGMISPDVIETLEWVLGLITDEECDSLFNLSAKT